MVFDPVSDNAFQTTDTQYQYSDVNIIAIHHALVKSSIAPEDGCGCRPATKRVFQLNPQPDMANIDKKQNVMRPVEIYPNGEALHYP